MSTSNGTTSGVSAYEADLDQLYAWMPPQTPPQPLPEAAFSLTLRGQLDGVEALFTIRGQTPGEFKRNLSEVRGLLDPPQIPQASSQGEGWCKIHNVTMKRNDKNGRQWYSHQAAGQWCKGK